jgi:undecaprenyl-diphosphatase
VSEGWRLLRACWAIFLAHRLLALAMLASSLLLAALIWPRDHAWLAALQGSSAGAASDLHSLAWFLGTFGDYPTYNLPFALLLWIAGMATRRPFWCRLAIVALLGATLAGIFDDAFRLTLGRPRPDANLPDGFYGPIHALHGGYQSFPSGHAASTFGMGIALVLVDLPLGLLTTCFACAVVWARLELNRHYPTDVLVGAAIGTYFGLLVGFAARRLPAAPPLDSRSGSI